MPLGMNSSDFYLGAIGTIALIVSFFVHDDIVKTILYVIGFVSWFIPGYKMVFGR